MRLIDRHPRLDADALARRFVPPHRFEDVRFDTYRPNPEYPGQQVAMETLRSFAESVPNQEPARGRWRRAHRRRSDDGKRARYLDGGFGVGKTHLLASMWHLAPRPKAYLTFSELTAFIGFTGMVDAIEAFRHQRLVCIDEFELDDVANTLMVVSFLRGVMEGPTRLAVTSNTLPDRLGEQRFSASEFTREIAAIAEHFDEMRIDGPDYRTSVAALPLTQHTADAEHVSTDRFDDLLPHLRTVHPVQYGALLDDLDGVVIEGMHPIDNQDDALLTVHLVDKLYDARIPVRIEGCSVDELFPASYRNGGYRKKYGRAESRITAMSAESIGIV